MLNKKILLVAMLSAGFTATVQAADEVHHLNFKEAVDRAVADGTLDGSVKFYLSGTKSGGKVIQKDVVTNKKTNGFAKSAEDSCDWVLRSALIQMQNNAKAQGANAVTNIVSYFKSNETRSTTTYDCYKGTMMAGVTLKGDIVKF
ncbi:excinuclease [Acinetobacter sp. V110_1]|uniref:excinuclease n=1 Tax=unclassified Acinetobacter TaxID=196816 RepID=UPI0021E56411|nr:MULTISPECIES: excinuclease [unclassified Acinetobacter]MDS7942916.1 excinuclease [Acinetobacter sp. V110_1]MDS7967145.1 excinuclease [Acinetobacter sp. V117_2]